jgi:molecular chaperone HscB
MFFARRLTCRLRTVRFIRPSSSLPRPNKCPNCAAVLPSFLPACTKCWHISPLPSDAKFHDIFGLPYHPNPFIIDVAALKQKFRQAQAICHPDSWASRGSVRPTYHFLLIHLDLCLKNKQDVAQALSSRINEAYQRLLTPLSRAEYLLECHHYPISETDQVDNLEFMSDIMHARETIEEAVDRDEVQFLTDENYGMCSGDSVVSELNEHLLQPRFNTLLPNWKR